MLLKVICNMSLPPALALLICGRIGFIALVFRCLTALTLQCSPGSALCYSILLMPRTHLVALLLTWPLWQAVADVFAVRWRMTVPEKKLKLIIQL